MREPNATPLSTNFSKKYSPFSLEPQPFYTQKGMLGEGLQNWGFLIPPLQIGHQGSNTTTTIPLWNDILSATYFFVLGSLVATATPRIPYYRPITIGWLRPGVIYPQGMIPYQPNNNEVMASREKGHLVGNQLCITQQNSHFYPGQDLLTFK